ncbi:MAG: histidine phosphatase family protein [Candidatus Aenigmarchaeota archaeon]|nr:histidine phosphatase family protein [Candidatus Aenigmarchaeota archaeon]
MLICYLVRHGETEWNLKKIHQGHMDSPLTDKGKEDAEEKGKILQNRGIKIIYSSDLGRASQTAEIINSFLHLPVSYISKLRERNFGVCNGRPAAEVEKALGDFWDLNKAPQGGENLHQIRDRALSFITELERKETGPVLIVTHEGPTRIVLSEILHKEMSECATNQGFIGRFVVENGRLKNFEFIRH